MGSTSARHDVAQPAERPGRLTILSHGPDAVEALYRFSQVVRSTTERDIHTHLGM
jgi:hypothetical protein